MVRKYIDLHLKSKTNCLPTTISNENITTTSSLTTINNEDSVAKIIKLENSDDANYQIFDNEITLRRTSTVSNVTLTPKITNPYFYHDKQDLVSDDNRFHCLKCTKSYKNKRHLQTHEKEECIDVEPRFRCDICQNVFRRKYHLSRHIANKHKTPNKFFF